IAIDSNSAHAWSGLSLSLALSIAFEGKPVDSVGPLVAASAAQALKLDRTLSEPHDAMGIVYALEWEWAKAENEFKTALRLSPTDIEARVQYIRLINLVRGPMAAVAQIDSALDDDRASAMVLAFKSLNHLQRGDLDSALVWSDRAMQSSADNLIVRF